jgi:alkylation response protein AidB-like acyl-CoA dehydrogenase
MHFAPDETQEMVAATARRFADERLRPTAQHRDETGQFPLDLMVEAARLGLIGINVDSAYGGSEAGVVAYSLAITEVARGDASVAVTMSVNNMVCEVLAQFGSPAQRARYIPALTSGESPAGSFCLSEPGSGSDAQAMRTRAERTANGWTLSGNKAWITSGSYASVFLVWAKTRMESGEDRISAFVVDPKTPGIHIGKPERKMGQHGSNTVPVAFDHVEIAADSVLGELGQGFKVAMVALDGGRIGIASLALGLAQEALSVAAKYAAERVQFGKPLSEMQATQFKIADMATKIEAARLLTLRAAWLKEQGRPFTREASMAKLFSTEMASQVTDEAVQILGGYGYTKDYPAERLMRDARVTRIYEGTSEIQRIVIARDVLRELAR